MAALQYHSTRNTQTLVSFKQAVLLGLSPGDGGLFVPVASQLDAAAKTMAMRLGDPLTATFAQTAFAVLKVFVGEEDVPDADLQRIIDASFASFAHEQVTPLHQLSSNVYILELFHGPTFAFKDVALQFLGNLFEYFLSKATKEEQDKGLTVLGATSGDTGSAAIYGLRGKAHIETFVLHPRGRVSKVQELQMTTVTEPNVHNIAVEGTFDDCQNIVKDLFGDEAFRQKHNLTAINSINWARIAAQIVYYFHAHHQLIRTYGPDIKLQISVPTGNFGDVLAGYYARIMGVPITTLVAAVNKNDILARFFATGSYERLAAAEPSLSPAMDIQISSNFERYLFALSGQNSDVLAQWMSSFKTTGKLSVSPEQLQQARDTFLSTSVSDSETLDAIDRYHRSGYDLCPHTAVGVVAAERLLLSAPASPSTVTICLATAHPAKFPEAFERATNGTSPKQPAALAALQGLPSRCLQVDRADAALVQALIESTLSKNK